MRAQQIPFANRVSKVWLGKEPTQMYAQAVKRQNQIVDSGVSWKGMDINSKNKDRLRKIVSTNGMFISIDQNATSRINLEYLRVQMRTTIGCKIDFIQDVRINGTIYHVVIREEKKIFENSCLPTWHQNYVEDTYVDPTSPNLRRYSFLTPYRSAQSNNASLPTFSSPFGPLAPSLPRSPSFS
ncbi:hypothetical protein ACSQ67_016931 [Phaseolus vulgaris]